MEVHNAFLQPELLSEPVANSPNYLNAKMRVFYEKFTPLYVSSLCLRMGWCIPPGNHIPDC